MSLIAKFYSWFRAIGRGNSWNINAKDKIKVNTRFNILKRFFLVQMRPNQYLSFSGG